VSHADADADADAEARLADRCRVTCPRLDGHHYYAGGVP
jgi:hypothetical protein